ncbi:hypothetical protein MVEG_00051 [Podila verticillata NRRL 6337]|nr:hypothetical protein MVEG_00051 [Podila verticillata NRRL 6337]
MPLQLHAFPLLTRWSIEPEIYHGFLSVMDREIEVYIEFPNKKQRDPIAHKQLVAGSLGAISGSDELKEMLAGKEKVLQQKMEEAMDMNGFLIEFIDMLEAIISTNEHNSQLKPVSYWTHITEQLDSVGWDRVAHLDQEMAKVQIELSDQAGRKHILTACFSPAFPNVPFTVEPLAVPQCDNSNNLDQETIPTNQLSLANGSSLRDAVRQAEKKLALFQDFWDVMQDFDDKTWVIDPEKPTRSDRVRRCALGKHCSIQITVDPLSPRTLPESRLFGPPALVDPMRVNLHRNAPLWDKTRFPRENLENLLELADGFPSPTAVAKDTMHIECGICYAFRYEGQVPDQICGHAKCQRPYHRLCLYEWLRSLPTTRQSFHTLFGQCPYCSETITTTVPKT